MSETMLATPVQQSGTELYLLAGVPLDRLQTDQLYIPIDEGKSSQVNQANWFITRYLKRVGDGNENSALYYNGTTTVGHKLLTTAAFRRVRDSRTTNAFYIPTNQINVLDCNYLIFRINTFHDTVGTAYDYIPNKVYFAFITEVNYINALTTEVVFEIDPIQSFLPQVEIQSAFVKRINPVSEINFEYTGDDYVDIDYYVSGKKAGTYLSDVFSTPSAATKPYINVLLSKMPQTGTNFDNFFGRSFLINGTYIDLFVGSFGKNERSILEEGLQKVLDANIVGVVTSPLPMVKYIKGVPSIADAPEMNSILYPYTAITDMNFGNYVAKNKKMLCYPYQSVQFTTKNGDNVILKPESFPLADNIKCTVVLSRALPVTAQIIPNIKEFPSNNMINLSYDVNGSWIVNNFATWLSQNEDKFIYNTMMNGVNSVIYTANGISSGDMGGVASGLVGMISTPIQSSIELESKSRMPNNVVKNFNTGNAAFITPIADINFCVNKCDEESARKIDTFFTMFGYAVNRMYGGQEITSDINRRYEERKSCYIKATDMTITPLNNSHGSDVSYPVQPKGVNGINIEEIKRLFANGLRFWSTDEIDTFMGVYN